MSQEQITITIHPNGTVEMEGLHYQGQACDKDLRALAEALGTVEKVEHKAEFFQTTQTKSVNRTVGGGS